MMRQIRKKRDLNTYLFIGVLSVLVGWVMFI